MIIFLYGTDTYRSRQKLKEIIAQYQQKHQSGMELVRFETLDWSQLKNRIEMISEVGDIT